MLLYQLTLVVLFFYLFHGGGGCLLLIHVYGYRAKFPFVFPHISVQVEKLSVLYYGSYIDFQWILYFHWIYLLLLAITKLIQIY